ncbi:MAG TPA: PilZ domain-containing protein [Candidatus Acidoferrum sp.]|nr:PilZ domain-containing protein [Candidatus Acidoferrum sp.]
MKSHSNPKPSFYATPGTVPAGTHGAKSAVRPALTRQPTAEERRRAQRVLLRMPVVVHLKDKSEPVSGFTHTVSASGAMIIVPEGFSAGTKFILENPKTQEKVEVNVVRPSQLNQEGSLVPVEFVTPAPNFWNIFFPPNVN